MNKAQTIATDIEEGNFSLHDLHQAAALLRQQDEALRMALEALQAALSDDQPYIERGRAAIAKIKEVLHD